MGDFPLRTTIAWLVFWLCTPPIGMAATHSEQLAIDSYRHLVSQENLLDGAIRSGNKQDFNRFIYQPTYLLMQRWPKLGDPDYSQFLRCYFALDEFINYSEEQFKTRGMSPKNSPSAKAYFGQKELCKKSLKGRV